MIFRRILCLEDSYFKFRPDPVTLGELEGETGILGKCENWGIFILRIVDRILMKLDIQKDLMSQMLHFQNELDLGI